MALPLCADRKHKAPGKKTRREGKGAREQEGKGAGAQKRKGTREQAGKRAGGQEGKKKTSTKTGTKTPTRITKDELDASIDLIIEIKKNHARTIASGYGELADLFASGEIIMAQAWEPVAAWSGEKGIELDWTVPKEGTWTLIDCLALITDSPNEKEAYLMMNHGLSGEAQAHVANVNTTAVTVESAVSLLNDRARGMYPYEDIPQFFASTGGGPFPLWPLDREGDYVTFDDVLDGWERFLKA